MSTYSWTLPATAPSSATVAEQDRAQQSLFGTDIKFEGDYEINSAGDYILVYGLDALRAAIYRRLITRPGEYTFVPEYGVGLQTYVKQKMTTSVIDELKGKIRANLLRDPRILEIKEIAVEKGNDTIKLGLKIVALGRALYYLPFQFSTEI
jgi:phage baseplate assembly protein W